MRKLIISIFILFFFGINGANAESISRLVHSLNINPGAVSVSVKDIKSGATVYSLNERVPRNPASTLKIITSAASLKTLGEEYNFTTKLYKNTNNELYIKLGADPLLKSEDLETLIEIAKEKNILTPKKIYIDDTIFDDVEWGEGWQWDDELNPYMPKFSAYNLDNNLVNIEITPVNNGMAPAITVKPFYPITIMNLVNTDRKSANNVKLERNNNIAANIIKASGVVSKTEIIKIPVFSPKMYFKLRLEDTIKKQKYEYYEPIEYSKMPNQNIYLAGEVTHPIEEVLERVLKNSENCSAESLFKIAGATWSDSQGSIDNSVAMLNAYLDNTNINHDDIKIVDGSGVSKNNLMSTDFMTDFLVNIYQDENYQSFIKLFPTPGEGTLKNRMLYFKNNLKAKTGTLSDTSAISGYLTTRKGKIYAFDIMIKDAKTSNADKKNIEEQILRYIYMN